MFIKIQGNFKEVTDAIGLPSIFYAPMEKEDYLSVIGRDLPRTPYFSEFTPSFAIKKRLLDLSSYYQKDSEALANENIFPSYVQGFEGRFFTMRLAMAEIAKDEPLSPDAELLMKAFELKSQGIPFKDELHFCYIDDDNTLCGLALSYLRDESNPDIPETQRAFRYALAIVKHVDKTPSERKVTFITDQSLLPSLSENGLIAHNEVLLEVKKSLHSETLNDLLVPCIKTNALDLPAFNSLKERFTPNQNIDNSDNIVVLTQLFYIAERIKIHLGSESQLYQNLSSSLHRVTKNWPATLENEMESIVSECKTAEEIANLPPLPKELVNDIKRDLRETLAEWDTLHKTAHLNFNKKIQSFQKSSLDEAITQTLVRRNLPRLLSMAVNVLIVVSCVLMLTGVFFPLATISAFLSGLLMATTAIASAIALKNGMDVAHKESEINQYQSSLQARKVIATIDLTIDLEEFNHELEKNVADVTSFHIPPVEELGVEVANPKPIRRAIQISKLGHHPFFGRQDSDSTSDSSDLGRLDRLEIATTDSSSEDEGLERRSNSI